MWMATAIAAVAVTGAVPKEHHHHNEKSGLTLPHRIGEQPGLTIVADPAEISGVGGFVNVSWTGYAFGADKDWVGLYCGEGHPLVSAPIKFREVGYPNANGTMQFYVQNLRADCRFALINGGTQFPIVQGLSNPVVCKTEDHPTGVRIAVVDNNLGSEVTESTSVRISWNTGKGATDPVVRWGKSWDSLTNTVPADTLTLPKSELCGAPANGSGFADQGLFHTAVVEDLAWDSIILYQVGDAKHLASLSLSAEEADPAYWSPLSSVVTPPKPGTNPNGTTMFLAFGDMGQAPKLSENQQHSWDYSDHGEINAINTTRKMQAELAATLPPSYVLHIGDIAYSVGFLPEWDQFVEQVRPLASKIPWMTAVGNHEQGSATSFYGGQDSGGECGTPYSKYFRMPKPADTGLCTAEACTPWYAFRQGLVAFVVMSTEHDFTKTSAQYAWIASTLASIDRSITPYVVFAGHRPMYVDSQWNDKLPSDGAVSQQLRQNLEPLLLQYKVDLAMWGHHHTYQRTCAVFNSECKTGATTHVVIGMAGYTLTHDFNPTKPDYIQVRNDQHWGYTRVYVNNTHLRMQFVANDLDDVQDDFALPRQYP